MMQKWLLISILVCTINACIKPPCTQDNAYQFDYRGRPIKKHKRKDPPAFLIARCKKRQCETRKIHCHGNVKYRGTPFWKNPNPATGQDIKIYMDQ
jgi:hypothetical protein